MNTIKISFHQFYAIPEVLYSKKIRKELSFLKSETEFKKRIKQVIRGGRKKLDIFIPYYSNLFLKLTNDSYLYYYAKKYLFFRRVPLRPLIPIETRTVYWNEPRTVVKIALIAEVEKKVILSEKILEEESLENLRREIIKIFTNEKGKKKKNEQVKFCLLRAFFKEFSNIYLESSNVISIIELPSVHFQKLEEKNIEKIYSSKEKIDVLSLGIDTYAIVHYKKKNELFKKRVKKAILTAFMIKTLIQRIVSIIEENIFSELNMEEKIALVNYIVNTLNPILYHSIGRRSYYLPQNYQRKIFKKISTKLVIEREYQNLEQILIEKINLWDPHEKNRLLLEKNSQLDKLKNKIIKEGTKEKMFERPEGEHEIILDFMIDKYMSVLEKPKEYKLCMDGSILIGGLAAGSFRKINEWMQKENKYHDHKKININQFKMNKPRILVDMEKKGWIIIKPNLKGKAKFWYAVNEKHPVIAEKIAKK